jgi:hypothetical protein
MGFQSFNEMGSEEIARGFPRDNANDGCLARHANG